MKGSRYLLLAVLAVCGGILAYALMKPDFRSWLRDADAPVVAALNRGAEAYAAGDLEESGRAYGQAEELARAADADANQKWRERALADGGRDGKVAVTPRERFLAGKDSRLYRGGMHYFQNRISEATYGTALVSYQKLRVKYRLDGGKGFAPPETALAPALTALERGLAASPKSESLRLLKAEILAGAGRYNQAVKVLEETLLLDPECAEAYNQLGIIYSSRLAILDRQEWEKNRARALEMFQKAAAATALDGGKLADPLLNLGMYYATPDPGRAESAAPAPADAALARQYLREYLELVPDPELPGAQRARKILERLGQGTPEKK